MKGGASFSVRNLAGLLRLLLGHELLLITALDDIDEHQDDDDKVEGGLGHGLDLVVDLGEEIEGQPTTILDLTQGDIEVIREGAGDLSLL